MKVIRLMKPVDHAQIGHLYEHLFGMALYELFKSKGLYAYLDFHIGGRAYYCGIVELTLTLYSAEAIAQIEEIYSLEPRFGEDEINGALTQILAEKRADIRNVDTAVILKKLRKYQTTPWRPFSELMVKDAANHKKTRQGLEFKPRSSHQFMILRQDITLDAVFANRDKLTYWPLFFVVSCFLTRNLQEEIPTTTYCYTYDDFGHYSSRSVKETNLYRVDRRQATKLPSVVDVTKDLVRSMLTDNCIERLADYLQSADDSKELSSPDTEALYRKSALLIGDAGWREIGSEDNIRQVFKHSSIRFSLGKNNATFKLPEI